MSNFYILVIVVAVFGGLGGLISFWDPNVRFLNTGWFGHIFAGIAGAILSVALGVAVFRIELDSFGYAWDYTTQLAVLPELMYIAGLAVLGGYASLSLMPTLSNIALKRLEDEVSKAREETSEVMKKTSKLSSEENYVKGKIAFKLDSNWETALFYCEEALKENPEHANAWATKSMSLKRIGRLNEALEAAQKAVNYDSNDWRKWFNVACYQARLGLDFSEIEPTLKKCRQLVDKNQESRANLKLLLETDDDLSSLRDIEAFQEIQNSI